MAPVPGDVVGGYRLVRILGAGSRATVYLGCVDGETADDPPRTAAVKVHHAQVPDEALDREITALSRVAHPHLLSLLDLASLPTGRPCLVLERLGAGSLAQLLVDRPGLSGGEAVTVLAPVAAALDAAHGGGVAHGRVRASNVVFRESGAPVLVGFGDAALLDPARPPAVLARDELVLADRRGLRLLASTVLERVDGDRAREVLDAVTTAPVEADDFVPRFVERIFDLAEPAPVRLGRNEERPGRIAPPERLAAPAEIRAARDDASTPESRLAALLRRVAPASRAVRRIARGVRPRALMLGAAVAVSLVVALLVVPSGDGREVVTGTSGPAGSPTGAADPDGPASVASDSGEAEAAVVPPDPVMGDEPVAALVALLRERERCLRDLSVLCLDGVLQAGSAAAQRDSSVVRALADGGETADAAIRAPAPVLVERLGDTALVSFGDVPDTQPASALMMRGEAGWRIRDYVDGG